jgi:uncharacterized membrane protein YedE/YeeE
MPSRLGPLAVAVLAGGLFGAGLVLSGMTNPARITAFLDPLGGWDPSLAFVMAGAVGVYAIASRVIRRRNDPWFDRQFHVPPRRAVDARLVSGAALFGVGWGLGGFCPGPGIVAAAAGSHQALVFVLSMIAGMYLFRRYERASLE